MIAGLWKRWWVRWIAAFIAAPFIMTPSFMAAIILVYMFSSGFDFGDFLPPPDVLGFFVLAEWVAILPPLIVMEFGNRRFGAALPPGLVAAFLALYAGATGGLLIAMIEGSKYVRYQGNILLGSTLLFGCLIVAGGIAYAILSPFIQRWRHRHLTSGDASEVF